MRSVGSRFGSMFLLMWVAAVGVGPAGVAAADPPKEVGSGPAADSAAIPNAWTPLPGVVTGGQPTAADLATAKGHGFRTIINLRAEGETGADSGEAAEVSRLGMNYVSIPIASADDLTPDNVKKLAAALAGPEALPAIVHCASGNRAGAMLALKANQIDGKSPEEAMALGRRAGLTSKLEDAVRERLH